MHRDTVQQANQFLPYHQKDSIYQNLTLLTLDDGHESPKTKMHV